MSLSSRVRCVSNHQDSTLPLPLPLPLVLLQVLVRRTAERPVRRFT